MSSIDLADALTRAQRGDHATVCRQLRAHVARPELQGEERVSALMTLGAVEYYAGEYRASVDSCGQAADQAEGRGTPAPQAYSLSTRASSWLELGEVTHAVDDLLRTELLLLRIPATDPFAGRIRRSLAGSYAELEMFEHAAAQLETVTATDPGTGVADAINTSNLHLRWARHLQRLSAADEPTDERRSHLLQAASGLRRAVELMQDGPQTWAALVDKMQRETAAQLDPATGVGPLLELIDTGVDTGLANTTAVSLATLVTALRRLGRLNESAAAGRQALALIDDPRIYSETLTDVLFAVHRTDRALLAASDGGHDAGEDPGSADVGGAAAYLAAAADELALLRQERVDSYAARLHHELHRRDLADLRNRVQRDPLTGVGNRRALDDWFTRHPRGPALLALVDLNKFKAINDTFGLGAGDAVLSRFALALDTTLVPAAAVMRYGGDEFVIVRHGDDEADLASLAEQLADDIRSVATTLSIEDVAPGRRISASVGVHTAAAGQDTRSLLGQADRQMYQDKSSG